MDFAYNGNVRLFYRNIDGNGERKLIGENGGIFMKERLNKLLTVKSIVTILLTLVFCILCVTNVIEAKDFMTVFMVIITFYFSSQSEKENK